ncbi:uncharacterized protein LOC118648875 [Monomorium pharaonis]|uniref:uncharacterized protein LOC118648875 n=1 Tax=Monomorium pharaonis TaxID=307658 RepID=UPI001747D15D|nr:uncharacterized protein LOC118648875 [Monomorium pharaonis]
MNSLQLRAALQNIPCDTAGVYAADEIPTVWSKPAGIIANTDDHTKPGTHWVAMYVGRDGVGHYFDSYGLPPIIPQHLKRLRRNCKILFYNPQQFQSNTSDVCGQFCVMFVHLMCTGFGMHRFRDIFSNDLSRNDKIVRNYYNTYMTHQQSYISNKNQFIGRGMSHSGCASQTQSCYSRK